MKSIFVRIYGSMLVALLIVGAVFYFTFDAISTSRAEQYRKQLARGPFTLLAEGAAYYRGEQRIKWLQGIARSMGMNY
ncbi:MAG TPA: two-component sensor histidine kinase, partial [Pseudomonadales bacterium]|nr:two-component sensor histidine kinase [Pseudomonadales bacterium]